MSVIRKSGNPALSNALDIQEGLLQTKRLPLYTLRSTTNATCRPRVLLLGGSNSDLQLKRAFLNSVLPQYCDIATYEPRGIGRSGQPAGEWNMQDYAEDAIAFLDAIDWHGQVSVVGESFGGMTALHLSVLAPERVRCMIIASATAGGKHASFDIASFLALSRKDAALQSLYLQDTRHQELHQRDADSFERLLAEREKFETAFTEPSVNSGGYARLLNARRQHDCTHELAKIAMPVTIIAGKFDLQAPFESQKALASALPNASFHAFDEGHGVLFNSSAATTLAVDAIV